ncbi:hypothetical protein RB595_005542 [Gaeumannomyces hyphopodioides]
MRLSPGGAWFPADKCHLSTRLDSSLSEKQTPNEKAAGHPGNSLSTMASKRELIVAIDFGTTFTGVCWVETSRNIVFLWPSEDGYKSSLKVPSELRKTDGAYQWGFQIPHQIAVRDKLFKLRLQSDHGHPDRPKPEILTQIYLSYLHKYVWSVLAERLSDKVLRSVPIHIVITAPAMWDEQAVMKTRDAARDAGFQGIGDIEVVSESEAAAIYTLINTKDAVLEVGKRYVVCDAGGGTVDLITYEITEMRELTVREVTASSGARCGSALLNDRFKLYLQSQHPGYWDELKLSEPTQEFEVYKKTWKPDAEPMVLVVDRSIDPEYQRFEVPRKDMVDIFEPIIGEILGLIRRQVEGAGSGVRAVLMAGGFAESSYLCSRVRDHVGREGIAVLWSESPWTAVMRGAAMKGLSRVAPHLSQLRLISRVAKKSYGVELRVPFRDKVHDKSKKYRDRNGLKYFVKAMKWFITKGEPYPKNEAIRFDFAYNIPYSRRGADPDREIAIYCHSASTPPPVHKDEDTIKIASLKLDKSRISQETLDDAGRYWDGIHRYYSIAGAVEVSYGSALVEYRVKLAGRVHDTFEVDYDEKLSNGDRLGCGQVPLTETDGEGSLVELPRGGSPR